MATGWQASRGKPQEQRIRDLEDELSRLRSQIDTLIGNGSTAGAGTAQGSGGNAVRFPIPEVKVRFTEVDGHDHSGAEGHGTPVAHSSLTTPGSALLDGSRHSDTASAAPVRGDLIIGNSSAVWGRLAIGTATRVLKSDGTDPSWAFVAHSELSGTGSPLLNGSSHSDTAAGTVVAGDLIVGNETPAWSRLARGASGFFLKAGASVLAWAQVAFTDIAGAITAAQHGNLVSTAGTTADHSGTISANARIQAALNGSNVGSPRPTVDFIEGTNVTITVTDTGSKYTVEFAQTSVSAATVIVKEGGSTVVAAADTLNFAAADFNITESPSGTAAIAWQGFTVEESNVSVATDVKDLDFGAGFDVTASGGEAEIALDLSEAVTGDVVFTGNAGEVQKIWGFALQEPTASHHLMRLSWDEDNLTAKWWRGDFSIEGFSRSSVAAIGTTDSVVGRVGSAGGNINVGWVAPCAGLVTGMTVYYEGVIDPGSDSHILTVYKNGVASALVLTNTGPVDYGYSFNTTTVSFAAGDKIDLYDKRSGTLNAVGYQASLFVVLKS